MSRFRALTRETAHRPEYLVVDLDAEQVRCGEIPDYATAVYLAAVLNGAVVDGSLPPCFDLAGDPSGEPW